jgi:hypothetical protein
VGSTRRFPPRRSGQARPATTQEPGLERKAPGGRRPPRPSGRPRVGPLAPMPPDEGSAPMMISVFVRWWSWTEKRADLPATMTCEPGPGLGDRRQWRADPGAYPAAGGELSQVQHQVGLETPHTRAPRPGCAGNGPLPIPRIAVSRRFRSASHSGVATARSSRMTAALRADPTQLHARQRTLSLVTSGGLIGFLVWAKGTAAGCRSSCGSASTRRSSDAARPRSVWPARDHSSSPRNDACCSARPGWVGMLDRCR